MGWFHKTRTWYLVAVLYVVLAAVLGRGFRRSTPLSAIQLGWRVLAAGATSANVFISDRYHNPDRRLWAGRERAYSAEAEMWALRSDYVGISSVLTTQLWLWSANMGWMLKLPLVAWASGVATFLVTLLSFLVVPAKSGHRLVKALMGCQFMAMLGYLAYSVMAVAPAPCKSTVLIFFTYFPGLLVYALKWPKSSIFGFHEWFHTSVLCGHTISMIFDLRNVLAPCVGSVACVGGQCAAAATALL